MAQRQSHSFPILSISLSLLSAVAIANAAGLSTSVFPNSACSGAVPNGKGLVGIGRVTLSTGEVETHCGCPSDNLPSFEACPTSSNGESVCNSVLDLDSGAFTASCSVVSCQGAECPSTVINTVTVDDEECLTTGKGALGYVTIDGESKCACASEGAEFTECPVPENGRAACVAVDDDFLGMSFNHKESVKCGVVCDDGFVQTPAGACIAHVKRAPEPNHFDIKRSHHPSPSHHHHHPSKSAVWDPTGPIKVGPSATHHHHHHHHKPTHKPSATHHHHHHKPSHTHDPSKKWTPTTWEWKPTGIHTRPGGMDHWQHHEHHHKPSHTHKPSKIVTKLGPSPSHRVKRAEEFVFTNEVCAAEERQCTSGELGDFTCVRLDDVTECGGCHSTGDAINCLELPGIQSAVCLKGGCVVRACAAGFEQTSEGACTAKTA